MITTEDYALIQRILGNLEGCTYLLPEKYHEAMFDNISLLSDTIDKYKPDRNNDRPFD
jgi:hypothetical protein